MGAVACLKATGDHTRMVGPSTDNGMTRTGVPIAVHLLYEPTRTDSSQLVDKTVDNLRETPIGLCKIAGLDVDKY